MEEGNRLGQGRKDGGKERWRKGTDWVKKEGRKDWKSDGGKKEGRQEGKKSEREQEG